MTCRACIRRCELIHPDCIRVWKDTRGWCWTCDDCMNCRRRGVLKATAQNEINWHLLKCRKNRPVSWQTPVDIASMLRATRRAL